MQVRIYGVSQHPLVDLVVNALPEAALDLRAHSMPIWIGAAGTLTSQLPALGAARRASGLPHIGYLLIDGDFPRVGELDWPDRPVAYLATSQAYQSHARAAADRGWRVIESIEQLPLHL